VEAVVCDAPALLSGRIGEAGAMVKEFVDYRGTTAAALSAAQEAGFAEALRAALAAGAAKARAMAG
jgi:pyrroline-5-carboxylate reductase